MHTPNFAPYPDGFSYKSSVAEVYDAIDEQTVVL